MKHYEAFDMLYKVQEIIMIPSKTIFEFLTKMVHCYYNVLLSTIYFYPLVNEIFICFNHFRFIKHASTLIIFLFYRKIEILNKTFHIKNKTIRRNRVPLTRATFNVYLIRKFLK